MKEGYHILIIILLVVIIGLLIYHMMHNNKSSKKMESFSNYGTNGYRPKMEPKNCAKWADYGECTTNWNYMINKYINRYFFPQLYFFFTMRFHIINK